MSRGITLSEKHGVNPSLLSCPLCGQDTGVALCGRMRGDEEAPRHMRDQEPCTECKEHMDMGFLLIEHEGDMITGRRWVITLEAAENIFVDADLSKGAAHIDSEAAVKIGLPRED